MGRPKLVVLVALLVLPLLLPGCCLFHRCPPPGHGPRVEEAPFPVRQRGPGAGYVLGTADFELNGVVQVKIQVEPLSIANTEDEASIQVWSGSGAKPADISQLPPAGAPNVYDSSGDVELRHWTTHLVRYYDQGSPPPPFWVVAKVDRRGTSGNPRVVKWLWYEWAPNPTAPLDSPHDFNLYPEP